ncbi:response regulator transcription factor [Gramella sp. AN32]|uniref:Response regulator transcription factor n=1 Tax=Christiangramia antarctica TaxID=2058158 RepID=A0ABW5X5L0_9FLAO|nr:response regulator transcription factor [Gramella sp. AN32]MCM4158123.1 DNA-binding response regulator [Gramella sp. AN32]
MKNKFKILLVEDDSTLGYLLSEYLQIKGFVVTWVQDGKFALNKMESNIYDLVILDVMMPEMDGFTLASKMQNKFSDLPFIFLTAKSLKIDVLKGFSLGAMDYLKKPIDEEELVIRIQKLLSRLRQTNNQVSSGIYNLGRYSFNSLNHTLSYNGQTIHLTSRENEILKFLVRHKNQLCSHKEILLSIWGGNDYFNQKSLNVFITHLRKYLDKDPSLKIKNVHGQGFILKIEDKIP